MNILFLGDIMGRAGRDALAKQLPWLREELELDFIVVNAENATSGIGLSIDHAEQILKLGVNCITLGDHAFDQREMIAYIQHEPRIIRPINFAKTAPGNGMGIFKTDSGKRVLVTQVLGQVFMKKNFSDPFLTIEKLFLKPTTVVNMFALVVSLFRKAGKVSCFFFVRGGHG